MQSPDEQQTPSLPHSGGLMAEAHNLHSSFFSIDQLQQQITDLLNENQVLKENEARLHQSANLSPGFRWTMNTEKQCTWVNQHWLDFTGMRLEDIVQDGWKSCIHPDDLTHQFEFFSARFDTREKSTVEFRVRHHDGSYHWIRDIATPCFDKNEIFIGYAGIGTDIDERKQIEYESSLFQAFFSQSLEIQCIIEHGFFTKVNSTFCTVLGYSLNDLCDRPFMDFVHPEDQQKTLIEVEKLFQGQNTSGFINRYRCKDGSVRTLSWQAIADIPNQLILASARDITEEQEIEQQLKVLWLAVEQTSHSVIITDLNGKIEYINSAFCAVSGYSEDEIIGGNPKILKSGLTPIETYEAMWKTLGRGDIWQGEFTNRRKSGELYIESVRISPVRQSNGNITHYLAIKEDITEYKQAVNTIKEAKILLQSVIDSTPDWIQVKNKDHRFVLVNRSFAQAFNLNPEEMIGKLDTDFLLPAMFSQNKELAIRNWHQDDDAVFQGETIHDPKDKILIDNTVRIFDTFKGPLHDSSQQIYGVLSYARDVTERLINEQEQKMLEQQLRQAQKMELIGHLTGGIAHDFNNILASMLGYAEIIEMSEEIEKSQPLKQYINEILRAGIRAKELVAQLLAFSHKRELPLEPINVKPILNEVMTLLHSTMPASIQIQTEIGSELPQVLISPVNLHQIMMNLGINARDAISHTGTIKIAASAVTFDKLKTCDSCHRDFAGHYLLVSVSDNGSGILPDNLLKIFDPFFTTKGIGHGSGLGLSVLHGIVHSAHGHVVVNSTVNVGTEINIYLPAHAKSCTSAQHETTPTRKAIQLSGNVMIIDDESSIVGFITVLLSNLGCKVIGLTSSAEALKLFTENPQCADLIITDQAMPELTGAELAKAMLAIRPELPIIMSTGYSNSIDEEKARQIGIKRLLTKPVPAKILTDMVIEFLS